MNTLLQYCRNPMILSLLVLMSASSCGERGGYSLQGITQVVVGGEHACAIHSTGRLRCWGRNHVGQLGYGHTQDIGDNELPSTAGDVDVGGRVTQVALGSAHTCALLSTGNVRCWGSGGNGALGYGNPSTIGDNETPASAGDVPIGGTVIQIAAAGSRNCALLSTGALRCWGSGFLVGVGYAVGTSNIGDNETPASMGDLRIGGSAIAITAGQSYFCALLTTRNVRCWGAGAAGYLGYGYNTGVIGDNEHPEVMGDVPIGGTVAQLGRTHMTHTCVLLTTGRIRCWGNGGLGRLGYGNTNTVGLANTPATVGDVDVGGTVVQVAAGDVHTCAILSTGGIRCWGSGGFGRLGYGNAQSIGDDEVPASAGIVDVGGPAVQISAGLVHTCVVLAIGTVRCWGNGVNGRLGYGNTSIIGDDEAPASAGDVSIF